VGREELPCWLDEWFAWFLSPFIRFFFLSPFVRSFVQPQLLH
jgi:hypothetical protein